MKIASRIYVALLMAFIYVPIIMLFICSFTDSVVLGEWTGFSTDLYRNLFSGEIPQLVSILNNTIFMLVAVVLTSVVLGTSAAIGYHYHRCKRLKKLVYVSNTLSMTNPSIILAVSLLMLFLSMGVDRGAGTVFVAQTVLCVPFVFASVLPQLKGMSPDIYDASTDLGASRIRTLFCAILPQLREGILSGTVIAASLSLNDFAVTLFSRGASGFDTISTYIYADSKRGGLTPEFRALYTLIIGVMLLGIIAYNVRSGKKGREQ